MSIGARGQVCGEKEAPAQPFRGKLHGNKAELLKVTNLKKNLDRDKIRLPVSFTIFVASTILLGYIGGISNFTAEHPFITVILSIIVGIPALVGVFFRCPAFFLSAVLVGHEADKRGIAVAI